MLEFEMYIKGFGPYNDEITITSDGSKPYDQHFVLAFRALMSWLYAKCRSRNGRGVILKDDDTTSQHQETELRMNMNFKELGWISWGLKRSNGKFKSDVKDLTKAIDDHINRSGDMSSFLMFLRSYSFNNQPSLETLINDKEEYYSVNTREVEQLLPLLERNTFDCVDGLNLYAVLTHEVNACFRWGTSSYDSELHELITNNVIGDLSDYIKSFKFSVANNGYSIEFRVGVNQDEIRSVYKLLAMLIECYTFKALTGGICFFIIQDFDHSDRVIQNVLLSNESNLQAFLCGGNVLYGFL